MFDEMYLQKCEEYSGGEIIGANESNEFLTGYSYLWSCSYFTFVFRVIL